MNHALRLDIAANERRYQHKALIEKAKAAVAIGAVALLIGHVAFIAGQHIAGLFLH